jgi:hypothetical protein
MTTTVEAIHEAEVVELEGRLPLPEKALVKVTIHSGAAGCEGVERSAWLKLCEEAVPTTWVNPDDGFNESPPCESPGNKGTVHDER